jgi:hypothetical protein
VSSDHRAEKTLVEDDQWHPSTLRARIGRLSTVYS